MSLKIYINGKFFDKEDAKISVYDHGLLYGDGVFEGMRSYGGKVFRLEAASRPALELGQGDSAGDPDDAREEMAKAVERHAGANSINDGYIRAGGHARRRHAGARPQQVHQPAGHHHHRPHRAVSRRFYENGLAIITASTIRNHPAALSPRIKSLNYLNNILAKIEGSRPAASRR